LWCLIDEYSSAHCTLKECAKKLALNLQTAEQFQCLDLALFSLWKS
jgi:hypothetical protein